MFSTEIFLTISLLSSGFGSGCGCGFSGSGVGFSGSGFGSGLGSTGSTGFGCGAGAGLSGCDGSTGATGAMAEFISLSEPSKTSLPPPFTSWLVSFTAPKVSESDLKLADTSELS